MAWIKGRPKNPGFYFYRDELRGVTVIEAVETPNGVYYDIMARDVFDDFPEGEHWSEAIAEPDDVAGSLRN